MGLLAAALGSVTLSWDVSAGDVTGYSMHYGTASGLYTKTQDAGFATQVTITKLRRRVTYYFVATAYNADGVESLPSNEISYRVP